MKATYSEAFIEQALVKIYARGNRSVRDVTDDLNVSYHTVKNWMRNKSADKYKAVAIREKRPQDWAAEEQLVALHETHGLSGEALQAWCRERGLFPHHLTSWKAAFCIEAKEAMPGSRELRTLKEEIVALKREAVRKDKALAEAAALLILQKKFRALWEDEDR
jgi:transposase